MKLRGTEFGSVINASGAKNFFGHDAWWFHGVWNFFVWILKVLTLGFIRLGDLHALGCTFESKTTTLDGRDGNLRLRPVWYAYLVECLVFILTLGFVRLDLRRWGITTQPWSFRPWCIIVDFLRATILNKVGLSGHGARWLLQQGHWQKRKEPFFISFMSVASSSEDRLRELREFVTILQGYLHDFAAPVALEINLSCPNVGLHQGAADEAREMLKIAAILGIPVGIKINIEMDPAEAKLITDDPLCDFLTVSNTIPFGHLADKIDWLELFGTIISPLEGRGGKGGGGLSGAPLLPLVVDWLKQARAIGITKPIIAGGGVLKWRDVQTLYDAGASMVSLGSIFILRPWRVQGCIDFANYYGPQKERMSCTAC